MIGRGTPASWRAAVEPHCPRSLLPHAYTRPCRVTATPCARPRATVAISTPRSAWTTCSTSREDTPYEKSARAQGQVCGQCVRALVSGKCAGSVCDPWWMTFGAIRSI